MPVFGQALITNLYDRDVCRKENLKEIYHFHQEYLRPNHLIISLQKSFFSFFWVKMKKVMKLLLI
jgi:hypothetical protein